MGNPKSTQLSGERWQWQQEQSRAEGLERFWKDSCTSETDATLLAEKEESPAQPRFQGGWEGRMWWGAVRDTEQGSQHP